MGCDVLLNYSVFKLIYGLALVDVIISLQAFSTEVCTPFLLSLFKPKNG